jgi:8-oxo-dGTP pyrophosphatase MutT (NUDIX family)
LERGEKMKREFSAGGIIFNKQGQVLLIRNMAMRDPKKSYWGFPKGHIQEGESSQEAAVREVKEETGVEVSVIKKIGDSRYVFTLPATGEKIFKVVVMFAMNYEAGEVKFQEEELLDAKWFTPEDAMVLLSFSKDKEMFKKALEIKNG